MKTLDSVPTDTQGTLKMVMTGFHSNFPNERLAHLHYATLFTFVDYNDAGLPQYPPLAYM